MRLEARACRLCPRQCGAVRGEAAGSGRCGMGMLPVVARAALHPWEEPCISGSRGSGTVFFSGCPLGCVYCQNALISHGGQGERLSIAQLAEVFRSLEAQGAHNINLVNPTHFAPAIRAALRLYRPGIPILWNSSGYERPEALRILRGLVDIYLPDYKYISPESALRYSDAADYPTVALAALQEMCAQTGPPVYDAQGLLLRGTLVRHLILPGQSGQAMRILGSIRESLPPGTPVSLLAQYTPCGQAARFPEIHRSITRREYQLVRAHLYALGLTDGYVQQQAAASEAYIPTFDGTGLPASPLSEN